MKFRIGKVVEGAKTEEVVVEADSWFEVVERVLAEQGCFIDELDEEGNVVE